MLRCLQFLLNVVADGVTIKAGTQVSNSVLYGMGELEGEWRDLVGVAGQIAPIAPNQETQ